MSEQPETKELADAGRLVRQVLDPLKDLFVGKDEVIDLLGVCLVGRENLFILGPPGTAKSAIVQQLGRRLDGHVFEYLLTRFTEPNELFGPFDIRRLREGELLTNTEGMLPEAEFVFLDELLNANSAILNSLLTVLNERVFRRGRETRLLPTLMVVSASNRLPEDEALRALFDRFLLRVRCDNVGTEHLNQVLAAGWELEVGAGAAVAPLDTAAIRGLQRLLPQVDVRAVRPAYVELVRRLRQAGIEVSDRRAVKLQRLVAASALVCSRLTAQVSDLWVLRYIWDQEEQQEILKTLVQEALSRDPGGAGAHPRARDEDNPDPEALARDLERLRQRLGEPGADAERNTLRDRLGVLAGRCEWVKGEEQRQHLQQEVEGLWKLLGEQP